MNKRTKQTNKQTKKPQAINCGARTCDSGLQSYTCVTDAKNSALPQLIVD